jgi:dihydroorotase
MNVDLLIQNGTIVDPARGLQQAEDVGIKNGRIVELAHSAPTAGRVIDAQDCLIFPGLIDFHAHVFSPGTEFGVHADSALLPQGVTSVVDAGSAGLGNYESFVKTVAAFSQVRVFSLVNVSVTGQMTLRYDENVDPRYYDGEALKSLFAKYPGQLIGLKIRQGKDIVGELGLKPLQAALKIAEEIGCPVVVHVSDPPCTLDAIAALLRTGDVFCHVFHGRGPTIIARDGRVSPEIKAARKRGVVFDAANGKLNFSLAVARAAIADGFLPDVISTDLTTLTLYWDYAFGLPYLMSKYLALGVDLMDVAAACTATPAVLLGMKGVLGTLAPGALADVAILKPKRQPTRFFDHLGEQCRGETLLVPQMTVLGGQIVFRQIDFNH